MFEDFYKTLFKYDQFIDINNITSFPNNTSVREEFMNLEAIPSEDEVKKALFSMSPLKSPGPDGFHPVFFQRAWDKVGNKITKFVQLIFAQGAIPKEMNKTRICLIPKIDSPYKVHHFRPISLCNTIYKIVSKVIVNRLRPFMGNIISPNQAGFIAGRKATDNIIIANEVIHTIRKKKGKGGFMIAKMDLSKAYDKLSWVFIREVLVSTGFPPKLVGIIMSCVTSVSFEIAWQGLKSCTFNPTCGIRQGDPLSPFLFILCLNELSKSLHYNQEKGKFNPIKLNRKHKGISHLFFADDILLFCRAIPNQLSNLLSIINNFCEKAGLELNLEKSNVFVSPNTRTEVKRAIKQDIHIKFTTNLGNYLGLPLIHKRIGKPDFSMLFEKFNSHLASWKSNWISMAGRIVLANSVLSTLPIYAFQAMPIPKNITSGMDKIVRNFIWGDTPSNRKWHAIK